MSLTLTCEGPPLDVEGRARRALQEALALLERGEQERAPSPLHAYVIRRLPITVTQRHEECRAVGARLSARGAELLLNARFFLEELSDTATRASALRRAEQRLFLQHPRRLRDALLAERPRRRVEARLFWFCLGVEAQLSTSALAPLPGDLRADELELLEAREGVSADALYARLAPRLAEPAVAALVGREGAEDARVWLSHVDSATPLGPRAFAEGERALSALFTRARESLTPSALARLSPSELARVARVAPAAPPAARAPRRRAALPDADALISELQGRAALRERARAALGEVMEHMFIVDPFFGRALSACSVEVSEVVSTAGVTLIDGRLALVLNPSFFLHKLVSVAQRGAVLKHEALHIILAHVYQIHDPHLRADAELYNIAADLEVNQMIGEPWALPEGALTLHHPLFARLRLPPHEVAEVYYRLLLRVPHHELGRLRVRCRAGWGEHEGWESAGVAREEGAASDLASRRQRHELGRALDDAFRALQPDQRSALPHILSRLLLARTSSPPLDWREQLRRFGRQNDAERYLSARKQSRRAARHTRDALSARALTADALRYVAARSPALLPALPWGALPPEARAEALAADEGLRALGEEAPTPWARLPLLALHRAQQARPDLSWPGWEALSDAELKGLKLLRTPLSPRALPPELCLTLSRERPALLGPLSWALLGAALAEELRARHPHLRHAPELTWATLPPEALLSVVARRPELVRCGWADVPPHILARDGRFSFDGAAAFRVERLSRAPLEGHAERPARRAVLAVVDTSGSVDLEVLSRFYSELDALTAHADVHVLQVDDQVRHYERRAPRAAPPAFKDVYGRGGTSFDPALAWSREARVGVMTPVEGQMERARWVQARFDGVIYLTDGYAPTPRLLPGAPLLWVISPNGTDASVRGWEGTTGVAHMSPSPARSTHSS